MSEIKILLADVHPFLRSCLRLLIDSHADMKVIGEADNGRNVLEQVNKLQPDVLLLDLAMPELDGINVIKMLRKSGNMVKILVLTMHDEQEYLERVIQAGVDGYLFKKTANIKLIAALRDTAKVCHYDRARTC